MDFQSRLSFAQNAAVDAPRLLRDPDTPLTGIYLPRPKLPVVVDAIIVALQDLIFVLRKIFVLVKQFEGFSRGKN